MNKRIGICGMGGISALGQGATKVWEQYGQTASAITYDQPREQFCAAIPLEEELMVQEVLAENKYYGKVDRTVLLAILAARQAIANAGWQYENHIGINFGSSRGATDSFENYFEQYQNHPQKRAATLTSPLTTLGNIATWVGHDIASTGPQISHSMTCSSALQALLNGYAWLQSGLVDKFLVGGTEAPLTPFTMAQMQALKILSKAPASEKFPCRAMEEEKTKNTMVLGEGAAAFCMAVEPENPLAYIDGIGYGTEHFDHPTQISAEGHSLQTAMKMATQDLPLDSIDAVILHAPGTVQGDRAELSAIRAIFNQKIPKLTTNKWKIGHTLGASAALSVEFGLLMMQNNQFIGVPYLTNTFSEAQRIDRVLINAIGFGGNALSVVLSKK